MKAPFATLGMAKEIVRNAPAYSTIIEPFGDGGTLALELAKKKPKKHIVNIENPELFAALVFAQTPDRQKIKSFDWVASQETFDSVMRITATDGADAFYKFFYMKKFGMKVEPDADPIFDIFKTGEDLTPSLYGMPLMKVGLKGVELTNVDPLTISGQAGAFSILLPKKPEHVDAIKSRLSGWSGEFYFAAKAKDTNAVVEMASALSGLSVSAIAKASIMMATMGVATNYETSMRAIDPAKPDLGLSELQARASGAELSARKFTPGMTSFNARINAHEGMGDTKHFHSALESCQTCNHVGGMGEVLNLEIRPIASPAIDKIEQDALAKIDMAWNQTILDIIQGLGLPQDTSWGAANDVQNGMTNEGFSFTRVDKDFLIDATTEFAAAMLENETGNQGAMAEAFVRAWAQGVIDGYVRAGLSKPAGSISNEAAVANILAKTQQDISKFITEKMLPSIHKILGAGADSGENPIHIARKLHAKLGGNRWKWEQITRSQVAMAWDEAKHGEWGAEVSGGLIEDKFLWIPAPDACPVCMAHVPSNPYTLKTLPRVVLDTHPSDRCDTAPAGFGI